MSQPSNWAERFLALRLHCLFGYFRPKQQLSVSGNFFLHTLVAGRGIQGLRVNEEPDDQMHPVVLDILRAIVREARIYLASSSTRGIRLMIRTLIFGTSYASTRTPGQG